MGRAYYEHVPVGQDKGDKRGSHLTFDIEALWEISRRKDSSPDANANMSRHALGRFSFG
jgi:hypothetical protein